jgi:hypothetical protein
VSAPPADTSESLTDPGGKPPAGSPSEGGPVEPDASENAFWLASAGYELVQRRQAAEQTRAQVLDEARRQRPDLTDTKFGILTDQGFPLTVPFAATVDEVLAYLETFGPPPAPSAAAQRAAELQRSEVLQEARPRRPDLTDAEFAVLTDHEFSLTVPFVATVEQVLAYLDAARPRRRRRRSPSGSAGRPRLQESELRRELARLLAELRDEGEDRPTRALLAERLGIEPSTLGRRLQRFPALRTLLPTSGRPRRIDRA